MKKVLILLPSAHDFGARSKGWRSGLTVKLFSVLVLVYVLSLFMSPQIKAATLVRTIDTSSWNPPSPDPADAVFLTASNSFLVSDSEVNEMQIFTGRNLYLMSPQGNLLKTYTTTSFSNEPTGVAVNETGQILFFSDDNVKKVFILDLGEDRTLNTSDDKVSSFSTSVFGSNDPEDVSYGDGKLFISDGAGTEVYIVNPGANGIFDGVDDVVTHFDTLQFNQKDPEGIAYNYLAKTLFIVSRNGKEVVEVSPGGTLVRRIDISSARPFAPSGLEYAPSSLNPALMSLYITDRGVDNNADPTENDGKIYEFSLDGGTTITVFPTQTFAPQKPEDSNGDGKVDGFDYVAWWQNFGRNVNGGPSQGDFNNSGFVDGFDYVIWWLNFGK